MRGVIPSTRPAEPPIDGHPLDAAARRLTALDAAMLATFALLVTGHIVSAIGRLGWGSAAVTVGLTALALLALALRRAWRPLILRLLAFGLIAGVCELFTDFSGEVVAHSLRYPPREPMLWASPAYMPLSWMVVLAQIGYLAWRLAALLPRPLYSLPWLAMALTGLWGALNIPFYEEMAYHAGWWSYAPAPGLGHTPYYVMLFEGLIAAALPPLLANLQRRAPRAILLRGLLLGAWIPCAALASWLLIGR
ncbi:MAG TPA: hypothetical protein VHI51_15490 [Ktedonobacterales bacterium]|nr:hypothetical protein [Ktedonobacterales bacterium]